MGAGLMKGQQIVEKLFCVLERVQTLLELPALLDLLFASSSTGRAHSRSHHQPSASASLSQTQETVIAVYETKETDGCQSLLFGIRRLPIFPGRHQPSIFGV